MKITHVLVPVILMAVLLAFRIGSHLWRKLGKKSKNAVKALEKALELPLHELKRLIAEVQAVDHCKDGRKHGERIKVLLICHKISLADAGYKGTLEDILKECEQSYRRWHKNNCREQARNSSMHLAR